MLHACFNNRNENRPRLIKFLCSPLYLEKLMSLDAFGIAKVASLILNLIACMSGEYFPGPTGEIFRGLYDSNPLSDLGTEN